MGPTSFRWSERAYRRLAVLLGVITAIAFVIARFWVPAPGTVDELPAVVLVSVFVVVAVAGFGAGIRGHGLGTALVVATGPVGGLLAYLLGYRLFFPPSTDSPTWVLVLAFALASLLASLVGFGVGRIARARGGP